MRRLTNWILLLLAFAGAALGAATQFALLKAPVPPLAFYAIAAVCAGLLIIRALPLKARRAAVFLVALAAIVALTGGLAYFQFVIKPTHGQGLHQRRLRAEADDGRGRGGAKSRNGRRNCRRSARLRAYQGIAIAPQVGGVVAAIHFESGDDVEAGAPLVDIDNSVEEADLANGLAQLKNANVTLERAKMLIADGNTPQSTVDAAHRDARFGRRDGRAHARGDRAEGDQGALRRAARPAQRRSRAICRRRREPRRRCSGSIRSMSIFPPRRRRSPRSPSARR